MTVRARHGAVMLALAMALMACGYELHSDQSTDACPPGSEGCPCAAEASCDGALACVGGTCLVEQSGGEATSAGDTTGVSSTGGLHTSDAGTSDASTTGCGFVCESDAPPESPKCGVFEQDCPEGQKCSAYEEDDAGYLNSAGCFEVVGDGQHGDPCTIDVAEGAIDDCAAGVMCWYTDEDAAGVCVELCTGTPENPKCAPSNSSCLVCSGCAINLCLPGCDPLQQDCFVNAVCIGEQNGDGFFCVPDGSDGDGPEGTPCEFATTCNPGTLCVNPDFYPNPACQGSLGCCAPFCDLSDMNACAGVSVEGVSCVPYHEPGQAPPELENVGLCGLP